MTTTPTYAQQSKACPKGFTLSKGDCEAEPTLTCEPYGDNYELTNVENFGLMCYDV